MLLIECPVCEARYKVNPGNTNKQTSSIKCPACQNIFTISLSDGSSVPDTTPSADSRPKVLIVEDSRAFTSLLSDLLRPLDLNISTAASGNEALQSIAHDHPQLVIIDMILPDISGTEVVRKIKSFKSLSKTRFLMLSGAIVNGTIPPEIEECGADDFSAKSFKPEQLRKRVAALLEK